MARRFRIIRKRKEPSFSEQLELRARRICCDPRLKTGETSPVGTLEKNIALILHQITDVRGLHESLRRNLLQLERYVNTELMQMENRTPKYSPTRFPEREKFQRRLFQIEHERRRLALLESGAVRELHGHLLDQVNKHDQINFR